MKINIKIFQYSTLFYILAPYKTQIYYICFFYFFFFSLQLSKNLDVRSCKAEQLETILRDWKTQIKDNTIWSF